MSDNNDNKSEDFDKVIGSDAESIELSDVDSDADSDADSDDELVESDDELVKSDDESVESDAESDSESGGGELNFDPNAIGEERSDMQIGGETDGETDADDEDDETEDSDDEYFQKFDKEVRKQHLQEFHPESFTHNYDEIEKLTRVVRDKDGIIIDDLHRTVPILTKYEYTRILGLRAKQISSGAAIFVKVPETMIDSYLIAKQELQEKKIPFIVRRPIPNGGSEYWNIKDLEILNN